MIKCNKSQVVFSRSWEYSVGYDGDPAINLCGRARRWLCFMSTKNEKHCTYRSKSTTPEKCNQRLTPTINTKSHKHWDEIHAQAGWAHYQTYWGDVYKHRIRLKSVQSRHTAQIHKVHPLIHGTTHISLQMQQAIQIYRSTFAHLFWSQILWRFLFLRDKKNAFLRTVLHTKQAGRLANVFGVRTGK